MIAITLLARPIGRPCLIGLAGCLAALLAVPGARAAPVADGVQATVAASCKVYTNNLAFGSYNPLSATPTDGQTTVGVECTKTTTYTVALSYGMNGGTVANRIMVDTAGNQLTYNLYTDASRLNVWHNTCTGAGDPNCVSGTGTGPGNVQSWNVYGEVGMQQNKPAGQYSDTITVTVTFN